MHINAETEAEAGTISVATTIAGTCLHMRVRLLNRVVSKIYDDALRPFGVKSSQFNILVATGTIGLVSPGELSQRLQLDLSTVSRNVERLRARGWLEAVGADDGRARPFRLTRNGAKVIEDAFPNWQKAQDEAERILGPRGCGVMQAAAESVRKQAAKQ